MIIGTTIDGGEIIQDMNIATIVTITVGVIATMMGAGMITIAGRIETMIVTMMTTTAIIAGSMGRAVPVFGRLGFLSFVSGS